MALVTSLVVLFYCCVTADILTKLLQQCFLIFIVVPWFYLGNSQVSVYRTIGPTLVSSFVWVYKLHSRLLKKVILSVDMTINITRFILIIGNFLSVNMYAITCFCTDDANKMYVNVSLGHDTTVFLVGLYIFES